MLSFPDTPYAGEPAALFLDGNEPTYAMVGSLIQQTDQDGSLSYLLNFKGDEGHRLDSQVVPLFHWFSTPRTHSQAEEFLAWAEAPPGTLKELIQNDALVRVDTSDPWKAAKSLRGLRLRPLSLPDFDTELVTGLTAVKRTPESRFDTVASTELATILWGDLKPGDVPSMIKGLTRQNSLPLSVASRFVLTDVPLLLKHSYVRLEPVK